ncbi:MAG: ferritin, CCC1 [Candidatus Aramenus sulfurataquae]|jgi:VIT1/CCC1 family predicted Fe2+/Mn2+ transporter|uniref:Ferritin, CCC1 n=2 Tax=Candidatus Aramenus sulfurataquae TaxID=1326980 RepID=W7KUM8_9CREN|nr:MAG: ferritin, CCC1 [Candidatus Aramenus sulfurataquae]MCL7343558.1 VIT1/CCC1 family protein [Candidatus Aramenus sulfurataquae]
MDISKLIQENYQDEVFGHELYRSLASREKNLKVKETLEELAEGEGRHAEFWKNLASKFNVKLKKMSTWLRLKLLLFLFLRRVIGLTLTLKLSELGEISDSEKYDALSKMDVFSDTEKEEINKIKMEELYHEELLVQAQVNVEKIRDAIYGMSDGLIEVLAGVSGLSGVFVTPLLVGLGGLIIGISGTISMSIGAFLSSKSEEDIKKSASRKGQRVEEEGRSKESVTTTAVSYISGAIIPVAPFLLGFGGILGVLLAYIFTGIATFAVGSIIGLLSDVSPARKGAQMTGLAIGAAIVTHLIGLAFHGIS